MLKHNSRRVLDKANGRRVQRPIGGKWTAGYGRCSAETNRTELRECARNGVTAPYHYTVARMYGFYYLLWLFESVPAIL